MASNAGCLRVLPQDLMELQLGQIDLLLAMYPDDQSILIGETSSDLLDSLRSWCTFQSGAQPPGIPSDVSLLLTLHLDEQNIGVKIDVSGLRLQLEISIPLKYKDEGTVPLSDAPPARVRLRQPEWMSRAEVLELMTTVSEDEDVLTAIEQLRDAVVNHLQTTQANSTQKEENRRPEPIVRVWFYFPSISTRSKRDDLVTNAPSYHLTGFLLAGKPGILCLEGRSQDVDDYMKFIKTESWGDIPAHHKKVSERYREAGDDVNRVFAGMTEITDLVGERRGERANRQDMKALEAWMGERGLGEAFGRVFI
jgi:hypothetical protein